MLISNSTTLVCWCSTNQASVRSYQSNTFSPWHSENILWQDSLNSDSQHYPPISTKRINQLPLKNNNSSILMCSEETCTTRNKHVKNLSMWIVWTIITRIPSMWIVWTIITRIPDNWNKINFQLYSSLHVKRTTVFVC